MNYYLVKYSLKVCIESLTFQGETFTESLTFQGESFTESLHQTFNKLSIVYPKILKKYVFFYCKILDFQRFFDLFNDFWPKFVHFSNWKVCVFHYFWLFSWLLTTFWPLYIHFCLVNFSGFLESCHDLVKALSLQIFENWFSFGKDLVFCMADKCFQISFIRFLVIVYMFLK